MKEIVTQDGVRLINGISQGRRPTPVHRPPPTSAVLVRTDLTRIRADRNIEVFLRLARAN